MSVGALICIALILLVRRIWPDAKKEILRVVLYCSIPLLMYFSTTGAYLWMTPRMENINNLLFVLLVLFVIATLNLTKRQKGFKLNPMDFLIFIVIVIFPNLPSIHLQNPLIKLVVAKILILFFSYEIFLGEIRKEDTFLDMSLMASLLVVAMKGVI